MRKKIVKKNSGVEVTCLLSRRSYFSPSSNEVQTWSFRKSGSIFLEFLGCFPVEAVAFNTFFYQFGAKIKGECNVNSSEGHVFWDRTNT